MSVRRSLLLLAALSSCTHQASPDTAPASQHHGVDGGAAWSDADCKAAAATAGRLLTRVIEANSACKQDSECVDVGVGAGCFDYCSRAMNASAQPALDGARGEATQLCQQYKNAMCPALIPPPCVSPSQPRCVNGTCS